ncbi:hypothetical protein HG263_12150 [Pseudoalteromonas sp. JBTF-M23]|uniref:Uncharacterized protein n=1 Tax=Pseudoalteromonas caenipelagi TaxID=2726988 RepID=A0A849VC90_9GAMM|nr:hypothetical protein [Pseudoalteromonas caenipelagi]NOU51279.1 hypothetical protein [Pseudoalteromonas caenipelagi]
MRRKEIFRWFEQAEIEAFINGEVKQVLQALEIQGVAILDGGLWNVRAPDPVLYTNSAFIHSTELKNIEFDRMNIILKENFIGFKDRRLSIVFEPES